MDKRTRKPSTLLFSALLIVLTVSYPFIVYELLGIVSPLWFAIFILAVFTFRFIAMKAYQQRLSWFIWGAVALFCFTILFFRSPHLIKLYPAIMSLGMGFAFIGSLYTNETLIERFANIGGAPPPNAALPYIRKLTTTWGSLLFANAAVSAYTAFYSSLAKWTFYNGFLSYAIFGFFALAEWCYRQYFKKKNNIIDE